MKPRTKWLLLGAIFIAIVLVLALSLNRTAKAQHFTAKVERGDIHDVVEATGTINAVITVQVGSQVSGTISKLFVDFNSRVHKGDLVALNVDVGQTVAASLQAPTIFTIAQDLTKMLVYAKTDESDVGNIKVGKEVTFKVDAFPKETFHGKVSQVRMNATTVQNVVTYDTIIEFANPDLKLFPGMTAYVTIPVATVQNALKLPNTALRYKPPMAQEEILAICKRYGIEGGGRKKASDTAAEEGGQQTAGGGHERPAEAPLDAA